MDIMNWLGTLPGASAQGLIWGIMAIGVYITFKILDLADLTVDGSMVTGMATCAMLMTNGWNVWPAMFVAFLAGLAAGLLTGVFHTVFEIPAILSGILTQLILWSVNLKIMGQANRALPARSMAVLVTQLRKYEALVYLFLFCVVIIALLYWFFGTRYGMSIRATGCNEKMSRAQGINTNVNKVVGLALSNGIVALAGSLLAQYSGKADISDGRGAIVIGLAAVIIGEAIVSKMGQGFVIRLTGVIVGGIVYYVVYQTVIFLGLDADLLKMLSALVVAVFLAVPNLKKKYFSKAKVKGAA
ncbi:MAG: ABC transporter permease [Acutalibacteraceae bacterium]|nr:ABC transporter permease [Acutalibacteraceae bacterium]